MANSHGKRHDGRNLFHKKYEKESQDISSFDSSVLFRAEANQSAKETNQSVFPSPVTLESD